MMTDRSSETDRDAKEGRRRGMPVAVTFDE